MKTVNLIPFGLKWCAKQMNEEHTKPMINAKTIFQNCWRKHWWWLNIVIVMIFIRLVDMAASVAFLFSFCEIVHMYHI